MEWSVLFAGSSGAGKTQAIKTVSEVGVLEGHGQSQRTVSMDMGVVQLDCGRRMRLIGAPGDRRFEFMWDVLLQQARGLVVLVDHRLGDPLAELGYHLQALESRTSQRTLPVAVGLTHTDSHPHPVDLQPFEARLAQYLRSHPQRPPQGPVVALDPRQGTQVKSLLHSMGQLLAQHAAVRASAC